MKISLLSLFSALVVFTLSSFVFNDTGICITDAGAEFSATIPIDTLTRADRTPAKVNAISLDQKINPSDLATITERIPILIQMPPNATGTTSTNIIEYLLSLIGGLLTAIVLYFLNKWFPNIFPSRKIKDYPIKRE